MKPKHLTWIVGVVVVSSWVEAVSASEPVLPCLTELMTKITRPFQLAPRGTAPLKPGNRGTQPLAPPESRGTGNLRMEFRYFHPLVDTRRYEIRGPLGTPRQAAVQTVKSLIAFDQAFFRMGFKGPEKTRVLINDFSLLLRNEGAHYQKGGVKNHWSKEQPDLLALTPNKRSDGFVDHETIISHERMHSLLYRTYPEDAFVNRNSMIQEALADFAAAHFADSPVIGPNEDGVGQYLRNIMTRSTRSESPDGKARFFHPLNELREANYHINSMFFSNVLWRVRKEIGAERMNAFLKPFVDRLNDYRVSYHLVRPTQTPLKAGESEFGHEMASELSYFLAVLERSALDNAEGKKIRAVTVAVGQELKLDRSEINRFFDELSP